MAKVKFVIPEEFLGSNLFTKTGQWLHEEKLVDFSFSFNKNVNEIPKELTYTFANMVVDLFRYEDEFIKATTVSVEGEEEEAEPDVNTGNINSIRVGDTTITFGSGSDTSIYNKNLRSHQANLDTVVLDYESQLKKFRRLVW